MGPFGHQSRVPSASCLLFPHLAWQGNQGDFKHTGFPSRCVTISLREPALRLPQVSRSNSRSPFRLAAFAGKLRALRTASGCAGGHVSSSLHRPSATPLLEAFSRMESHQVSLLFAHVLQQYLLCWDFIPLCAVTVPYCYSQPARGPLGESFIALGVARRG